MINLIRFLVRAAKSVRFSRGLFSAIFVAGVVGGASNVAVLAIINHSLARGGGSRVVWSFAVLCLVLATNKYISQVLMVRFATGTVQDLRLQLSQRILASPFRHLEQTGFNRLFAAFTEDVPTLMNALIQIPNLCINLIIVVGCLGYAAWLSWKLFLLVLASLVVGMAGYHLLERRSTALLISARNEATKLLQGFRGLIVGAKELQMSRQRRIAYLEGDIQKRQDKASRDRIAATKNYAIAEVWGELIFYLVIGMLLFLFSSFQGGASTMVLTGYVLVFLYMLTPLQFILNTFPAVSTAAISVDRIQKLNLALLSASDGKSIAEQQSPVFTQWSTLELKNVCHTYRHEKDGTEFTLGPVNLQILPGEMIFITGGNGSGKTTLVKLLVGLYGPQQGEIFLDGQAIHDEERDNYRHLFSAVFADFFLFEELHGMRELDGKANAYLSYLQLDRKVTIKDGILSTIELSQGQRKRLALLIAYLEDRPIFVFDEWAADQDPAFREVFYRQILPELQRRGKAVIVVTHDDRYYDIADRVVKLDYGRVESDLVNPRKDLHKAYGVN
jgi:putative pyoverdin transport system ATP-binding/permease protein